MEEKYGLRAKQGKAPASFLPYLLPSKKLYKNLSAISRNPQEFLYL